MNSFNKKYPKTAKAIRYTGNALRVAHQAYNMAKVVASIVNSEKKYFDINHSIAPDTTASVTCLTNMAQGDTNITRNGNTVSLKSLNLQGMIYLPAVTENVRVMIVRDNDNLSGTAPAITDILESSSVVALRNKNTPKRFTVMMDKLIMYSTNQDYHKVNKYFKFGMKKDRQGNPTVSTKLYFDGVNAADYTRGHIFLVVLGSLATAGTASLLTLNSRIRFYDN